MTQVPSKEAVEAVLGFRILQWPGEYITALTHASAVGLPGAGARSFEKLEFLGDAIIGFVVGRHLYQAYPDANEGALTKLRTKLVSGQALAGVASRMGLGSIVIVSPRSRAKGFHASPRILEDAFEALCAAVYLDVGMVGARDFILKSILTHVDVQAAIAINDNYKDQAMQWCQARSLQLPTYTVMQHAPHRGFVVQAGFGGVAGYGTGRTKRAAEQDAARAALVALNAGSF
jgi:ribonuclease III